MLKIDLGEWRKKFELHSTPNCVYCQVELIRNKSVNWKWTEKIIPAKELEEWGKTQTLEDMERTTRIRYKKPICKCHS